MPLFNSQDILVVGAGVLGLCTAAELARRGHAVTVVDPGGLNASGVAAGMIAPAFEAVLDQAARPHAAILMAARDLWPAFATDFGIELDRRGAKAVGDGDRLARLAAAFAELGIAAEALGPAQAAALAPGLSAAFAGALFTAQDWRIEAAATLSALRRAAQSLGVSFRAEAASGPGEADQLVVATGAARDLVEQVPELAGLSPIKGHILRLPGVAYSGLVVRGPDGYAAPAEGGMTVGATMEAGLADTGIDPAQAARLLSVGQGMFPQLAQAADVRPVAGVRAATPDGLPLVGPGATPRTLLAVGARRNGWILAPLAAQIVTANAMGTDPGPLAARFDPARFG